MIYTRTFVEIYKQHNNRLVYRIYEMVEWEKYLISKLEKPLNLGMYQLCKISGVLQRAYIILRDIESNIFYINNYIKLNKFHHFYN